jgi:hypothetical protein
MTQGMTTGVAMPQSAYFLFLPSFLPPAFLPALLAWFSSFFILACW